MGWVLWTKSIDNSISLPDVNPRNYSAKTLGSPHVFVTLYNSYLLTCISLININYPWQPIFNNFLLPRPAVKLFGTQPCFPRKHKSNYLVSQLSLPCYIQLGWHDWRRTNLHSRSFKLYTNALVLVHDD
jgi:hypothetical protein